MLFPGVEVKQEGLEDPLTSVRVGETSFPSTTRQRDRRSPRVSLKRLNRDDDALGGLFSTASEHFGDQNFF